MKHDIYPPSYEMCECQKESCALWIKSRGECADKIVALVAIHNFPPGPDPRD
jgi:hypothetical protein